MATATRTRSKRTTKKAKPEPEVEEDDELDAETEEDEDEEDDEDEAPAPRRRSSKKKAAPAAKAKTNGKASDKEVLGSAWLKEHVNDTLGTDHESTKLRIVLRKLIKDGDIDSPKDGRYIFTGPKDPNVKAVVAALRSEAKSGPAKRGRKPKTKVIDETDDEEDVEDLDLDD